MRISGPDGNHSPTVITSLDVKLKEEIGQGQGAFNHDREELKGTTEDRVAGMIAKRIHGASFNPQMPLQHSHSLYVLPNCDQRFRKATTLHMWSPCRG